MKKKYLDSLSKTLGQIEKTPAENQTEKENLDMIIHNVDILKLIFLKDKPSKALIDKHLSILKIRSDGVLAHSKGDEVALKLYCLTCKAMTFCKVLYQISFN